MSADSVKTVNFVPPEELPRTVSVTVGLLSTVVKGLSCRRNHSVIIRQCLPCEKQTLRFVDLFLFFFHHGFTAEEMKGLNVNTKSLLEIFQCFQSWQIKIQDLGTFLHFFLTQAVNLKLT